MVAPYILDKFDIGLLRQDASTKVGLMLRRARNEVPKWAVFDDEYLAAQYFTGEPGYGNLPPEKELAIRQDDWRSGLGLEVYDASDPKRYHKSTMDMRFRGMGLAGWKSTAVPRRVGIINGSFEAASGGWVGGTRTTSHVYSGTYAWTVSPAENTAYQDINWDAGYQGKEFTFKCYCWHDTVSQAKISIDDGVGVTSSSFHAGGSVWEQLSVTRTLNGAATRLRLILDNSVGAGSPDWDDATLSSTTADTIVGTTTTGVIRCWAEFNDDLYIAMDAYLLKLNSTGTFFDDVKQFGANITALESFTDNRLYIALGTSNEYWYMSTAEVCTESTAVVKTFKYFKRVDAAVPTLWGSDGDNTIRSNANPQNGGDAWSGQTTVDTSYHSITSLKSEGGSLYVMKENRPYYLDSSGNVQSDLAPELEALTKSTDNGKNANFWLSKIFIPWGDQSLLEYDAGVNTWRSPALSVTGAAEYNGQIFAVYGDDQFLFAILDYSTKVEVLAGRLEVVDGTTKWVWHCINETTLTGCETAFISTVYQKRLWIASTAAGDSLYYIPLPLGYADVANDTNRDFLTGTTFETPWLHGNFKSTVKAFPELELVMGHAYNANRYFTVKYKKLEDSSWTTIGNYTGSATSMIQSRFIPVDASSNNPKSTMFKLQFTAVTNDTTITPILLGYHLKGILYPDQREIIACKVYCANEIQLRDGTIDKGSYDIIIATLDEARVATWPVTIYDVNGVTQTVKFLPLPNNVPRWTIIGNEKERKLELEYNLLLQKVALS